MSPGSNVPIVRPLSKDILEYRAKTIISSFCPETLSEAAPFPVLRFCDERLQEDFGVPFAVGHLGRGEEGRLDGHELTVSEVVYADALRDDGRARFTLAHELAHAVLHANQLRKINDARRGTPILFRREELRASEDPEWQANRFAAALLMPVDAVQFLINAYGISDLDTLAEFIRNDLSVSRSAARIRAVSLVQENRITLK